MSKSKTPVKDIVEINLKKQIQIILKKIAKHELFISKLEIMVKNKQYNEISNEIEEYKRYMSQKKL